MSENISEAFGALIGFIEVNGDSPEEAREKVIDEGYHGLEVDHLLEQYWNYEVEDE